MKDLQELQELMYEEAKEKLEELGEEDVGSDKYKTGIESVTKLVGSISDINEKEKVKEKENRDKIDRIVDRTLKIINTAASIAIPVGIALLSINFEKTGTITTEAGRNSIRKCLNFFK